MPRLHSLFAPFTLLIITVCGNAVAEDLFLALHGATDLLGQPRLIAGIDSDGVLDDAALQSAVQQALPADAPPQPRAVISAHDGAILVVGTIATHSRVHEILQAMRIKSYALSRFEVVIASAPLETLRCVSDSTSISSTPGARQMFSLSSAEHEQLLAALAAEAKTAALERYILAGPQQERIGCAHTLDSTYVSDCEVITFAKLTVCDPVLATTRPGFELWIEPRGLDSSGATTLDLEVRVNRLLEYSELKTTVGAFERPESMEQSLDERLAIPEGTTLLIPGLLDPLPLSAKGAGRKQERNLLVMIRPLASESAPPVSTPLAWINDETELAARRVPDAPRGESQLSLFDVRDILGPLQDFPGPNIEIATDDSDDEFSGIGADQALVEWIRTGVMADSWKEAGHNLEIRNRTLVVRTRPEILKLIEVFLNDLRNECAVLITIELRVIDVHDGKKTRFESDGVRIDGTLYSWGSVIDPAPLLAIVGLPDSDLDLLTAPRLTVFSGQRANITIANQVSYVADFEIERDQDALICDPIISVVQEGLTFDIRAVFAPDRTSVLLTAELHQSQIARPLRERDAPADDQKITLQLPDVTNRKLKSLVRIPASSTVLLTSPGLGKTRQLLLVTATITSLTEVEPR